LTDIIYYLDLFSTVVFAISGVILARRQKLDILGAIFLATMTAVGGGTTRDLVLGFRPVFWVGDVTYIYIILATSLISFVLLSKFPAPEKSLRLADALGLATVAVIGTEKAYVNGLDPLLAIAMGVITGIFGGVIRDTLANRTPIVFADPSLYATAAFFGALSFVLLAPFSHDAAVIIGILLTLAIRLAAIFFGLRLPDFLRSDS
jgi:uncharacterized membrane protein YeiH